MSSLLKGRSVRLALAAVAGVVALGTGVGVAYAAGVTEPAETGYATVVDEGGTGVDEGSAGQTDCPDRSGEPAPDEAAANE